MAAGEEIEWKTLWILGDMAFYVTYLRVAGCVSARFRPLKRRCHDSRISAFFAQRASWHPIITSPRWADRAGVQNRLLVAKARRQAWGTWRLST